MIVDKIRNFGKGFDYPSVELVFYRFDTGKFDQKEQGDHELSDLPQNMPFPLNLD